jgi:hypothetical protein
MLAVLSSYAVGLCALSRGYTVSTYLILGIATAYCALTAVPPGPSDEPVPISQVLAHLARLSFCAVIALYLFVKVMV